MSQPTEKEDTVTPFTQEHAQAFINTAAGVPYIFHPFFARETTM